MTDISRDRFVWRVVWIRAWFLVQMMSLDRFLDSVSPELAQISGPIDELGGSGLSLGTKEKNLLPHSIVPELSPIVLIG